MPPFVPSYGPLEQRLRNLEAWATAQGNNPRSAAKETHAIIVGGGSGPKAPTVDLIPEASVVFDATAGHAHDGTDSHSITLAGDVTGTNAAAVVAKIEGVPIAAPTSAEDKQAVYYNHGSVAWGYSGFSTLSLLGAWGTADCSALTGSDVEQINTLAVTAAALVSPMPAAGILKGLVIRLSADVGAAGNDVIVTVYKNGVATALTGTVTGAAGTENETVVSGGTVTFVAGDDISVYAKKNGTPAVVQACYTVWGNFTP